MRRLGGAILRAFLFGRLYDIRLCEPFDCPFGEAQDRLAGAQDKLPRQRKRGNPYYGDMSGLPRRCRSSQRRFNLIDSRTDCGGIPLVRAEAQSSAAP